MTTTTTQSAHPIIYHQPQTINYKPATQKPQPIISYHPITKKPVTHRPQTITHYQPATQKPQPVISYQPVTQKPVSYQKLQTSASASAHQQLCQLLQELPDSSHAVQPRI